MLIRHLFKKHLDFSFCDRSKGIHVRVLERPGKWLSDSQLQKIVQDLQSVVQESIPAGNLDYGVLKGNRQQLEQAVLTIIYDSKTGRALAFNALTYMPCELRGHHADVLHLGLVVVSPTCREGGFSWILYGLTSLLLFFRGRFRPIWVSNVSQVPAIIGNVSKSFAHVYPTPQKTERAGIDHLMLARQILAKHRAVFGVGPEATFDENDFVIQNAYTGGSDHLKKTFTQAQQHRSPEYNDFCREKLDYDRGDDFLQLGVLTLASCHEYLTRSVPRKSLLALGLGLGVMTLHGVFLPLFHWFDGKSHQGQVRPWA
ncbi:MAG: hypothetical protein KF789_10645 [Bdellovibrionaceae bacterium]|nr:hypothetical protein [Pseudobdellovibrionaceae bacterium]